MIVPQKLNSAFGPEGGGGGGGTQIFLRRGCAAANHEMGV